MRFEIDQQADAAYVELFEGQVSTTVELDPGVLVDLDNMGVVVGVELLGLSRELPVDQIISQCHVASIHEPGLRSLAAAMQMAGGSSLVAVASNSQTRPSVRTA